MPNLKPPKTLLHACSLKNTLSRRAKHVATQPRVNDYAMFRKLPCLLALFLVTSCNESTPFYDFPTDTRSELVIPYTEANTAMKTAWQPTAMFVEDDDVYFLDRATRELRVLRHGETTSQPVADLTAFERQLSNELFGDDTWGAALYRLNARLVLVAGAGRNLLVVDRQTGDAIAVVPDDTAAPAADGRSIAQTDFDAFIGAGLGVQSLYLAFNNQVFAIHLPQTDDLVAAVDQLRAQKLRHFAGAPDGTGNRDKLTRATDAKLDLSSRWTHFIERDDQVYFFTTDPSLRVVKNGQILNLGGDGNLIHGEDLSTMRFYGLTTPVAWQFCGNEICIANYYTSYLVRVFVEKADFETGECTGKVSYQPQTWPNPTSFVMTSDTSFLATTLSGGGIWQGDIDQDEASRRFGMSDETERFTLAQTDHEVNPPKVLLPQAIERLAGHIVLNAPTLSRITVSSTQNVTNASTIWLNLDANPITMFTARDNHLWMPQGSALYTLTLSDDNALSATEIPTFFRSASASSAQTDNTLGQTRLGRQIGGLFAGQNDTLYIWSKDTCTIWRVHGASQLEEQNLVDRIVTGPELCDATHVAVADFGAITVLQDRQIYTHYQGLLVPTATVDDEIYDVRYLGNQPVMLGSRGFWRCELHACQLVAPNPVTIQDKVIDFATPGQAKPRFMTAPGENAVLMPVMYGNQVIKIAL